MGSTLNKNKEGYGYCYTDLAEIHRYLESNDARYVQRIERIDGDDYIFTRRYINGEWEAEWLQGCRVVNAVLSGKSNPAQEQGSALTYARRYSLLMAFGLATDDDDAESLTVVKEATLEDAQNYELTFGKHKGKKLGEVDKSYLVWLRENSKDEYVKRLVELLAPLPSEEDQKEILELVTDINALLETTDTDREKFYKYYGVDSNKDMTLEQLRDAKNKLLQKVEL